MVPCVPPIFVIKQDENYYLEISVTGHPIVSNPCHRKILRKFKNLLVIFFYTNALLSNIMTIARTVYFYNLLLRVLKTVII